MLSCYVCVNVFFYYSGLIRKNHKSKDPFHQTKPTFLQKKNIITHINIDEWTYKLELIFFKKKIVVKYSSVNDFDFGSKLL